jgi:GNAT superfamily N-acetyltransferase
MDYQVRKARASDKEPLMSFIKDVWGGHDYIPYVWDEWIADESGQMFVVEAEGRAVAMNRVKVLEDGSAWFEGVRVHPEFRGRGLATMLGENSVKLAYDMGVRKFRLTSSSWNKPAHRQVRRMNFHEKARVSVYEPKKGARFGELRHARVAGRKDLDEVERVVRGSKEFALGGGVMWDGFAAIDMTKSVLSSAVAKGSVVLHGGAVAIARPAREGKNRWTQICFVGGPVEPALRLAGHMVRRGKKLGWRIAFVPQGSPIIPAMRKDGFKRSFSLVLFEKESAKG